MNYKSFFLLSGLLGLASVLGLAQAPAFLGIEFSKLSEKKRKALDIPYPNGSYVEAVWRQTAAEEAGLTPMDYLFGIDDRRTDRNTSLSDLLDEYRAGDQATIHFYHQGTPRQARIRFGSREAAEKPERKRDVFLGISPHRNNDDDRLGVRVYVMRRSVANQMGLRDGDLITHINGYPIVDWNDISLALDMLEPGDQINLNTERGRQRLDLFGIAESKNGPAYSNKPRERAYLGIYTRKISREKADKLGLDNPYGSYVSWVVPNTAADKAGIQPFDYIFGVDQYRVGREQDLVDILHKYYAGEEAQLHLIRQGDRLMKSVTFGERIPYEREELDHSERPFLGVRQSYGPHEEGVQVAIVRGSAAEAVGMEDGDVLTAINGNRILDWKDITMALDMLRAGDRIEVDWLRDGRRMDGRGTITSRAGLEGEQEAEESIIIERRNPGAKGIEKVTLRDLSSYEIMALNKATGLELSTDNALQVEQLQLEPGEDRDLRLSLSFPDRGKTSLQIFNDQGRLIYQYDLGDFSGPVRDKISLSGSAGSVFFLHIRQGDQSLTRKVAIQRN
jgi:S1-C subfamily serine protease